jgi:hypothetical protein
MGHGFTNVTAFSIGIWLFNLLWEWIMFRILHYNYRVVILDNTPANACRTTPEFSRRFPRTCGQGRSQHQWAILITFHDRKIRKFLFLLAMFEPSEASRNYSTNYPPPNQHRPCRMGSWKSSFHSTRANLIYFMGLYMWIYRRLRLIIIN